MRPNANATPVELIPARRLRFRRAESPLAGHDRACLDEWWRAYQAAHPHFHNGLGIACRRFVREADDLLTVEWYRTDYAHYLVREAPELGIAPAHSIFAAVALTSREGGLLVGRMAATTASPHRLQFPGGGVEIVEGEEMTPELCLRSALDELAEEVGLRLSTNQLTFWCVKTGGTSGDLGLFYRNVAPVSEVEVAESFAALIEREGRAGIPSELSEIRFLHPDDLPWDAGEPVVDYLEEAVRNA